MQQLNFPQPEQQVVPWSVFTLSLYDYVRPRLYRYESQSFHYRLRPQRIVAAKAEQMVSSSSCAEADVSQDDIF